MKLLIDTNIVLDLLLAREPFLEDARNLAIGVINREFEYSFEGFFTRDDYVNVVKYSSDEENNNFSS